MSRRACPRPTRGPNRRTRVAAALLAAAVLAGCTRSSAEEPELALLDEPAAPGDELPAELDGMALTGSRLVAEVDDARVWAARDEDDQWCVALLVEGAEDWVGASSCTTEHWFAKEGVRVSARGAGVDGLGARLVPDGYDGEVEPRWEQVTDNLLVRD